MWNVDIQMMGIKPQVVYFSDEQEMVELVTLNLSDQFEVTPITWVDHLDDALDALLQIMPDFVIVDPHLATLDHQQLYRRMQMDPALKGIQVLLVRDDT